MLQLRGTEFASSYELLQLFAYGTWPEYKRKCMCIITASAMRLHALSCFGSRQSRKQILAVRCLLDPVPVVCKRHGCAAIVCVAGNSSNLPPLNDAQQLKLKQLTVVSIALVEKVREEPSLAL